ncbi:MAG: hypothetical protein C4B57_01960 [Deltaproteobacteria bacterium]|nr:MAG: hypothetical protein C4B57_01960 [Deltaproteobacteria bacterium]
MGRKISIAASSILIIIAVFVFYRLSHLGAFLKIGNLNNANCSVLANLPGPEDLQIDRKKEILYFISYDRWAPRGTHVRGGIYSLNLKASQAGPKLICPDKPEDFHPHGFSLYQDNEGDNLLFVINHRQDGRQTIEVFAIQPNDRLQHLETIESGSTKWPNDLVAVGPRQFYLTDINRPYNGIGLKIDALLQLRKGRVVYYDGSDFQIVAEDLSFPNGINLSNDGKSVYVSETLAGNIDVFQRDRTSGRLNLLESHFVRVGLDNITVLQDGSLLVAVQPNLIALARHFKNPQATSPSQVLKIRINEEGYDFQEIYSSSGAQLSGASVAALYKNRLIIGSASESKILSCELDCADIKLKEWKEKGRFVTIKSHQIFYVVEGKGPELLLLHAYPTASWGWHRMWPELTGHFRVVAPDLLGSGFSDKPPDGDYSITYLTDVVEELLSKLKIKETHVLAHAYGSLVAQELLARFNEGSPKICLRSVCFIDGGIFPETAKTTPMQKFLLTSAGRVVARNFPTPYVIFKRNFSNTFGPETRPSSQEMKEFWELLTYNDGQRRVPEVIQYLNERIHKRGRWVNALQKTTVPLCLINSISDEFTGKATNKQWRRLLPHSSLIELASPVGHYPPLEDPDAVLKAYFDYVEKYL